MKKIVVLTPVFNEKNNIENFIDTINKTLSNIDINYSIYFIDDGSTDGSYELLKNITSNNDNIYCIRLSRNFGKEVALTAGINELTDEYDASIILDCDLQHPPDLVPKMLEKWKNGNKIIWTIRKNINYGFVRSMGSKLFFYIMSKLSKNYLKPKTTDFVLIDKDVIFELKKFTEKIRFFRGLLSSLGHESEYLYFDAPDRNSGKSNFNFYSLSSLAVETISSYTLFPLKLTGFIGILIIFISLLVFFYMLVSNFFGINYYTSLALVIVFNTFLFGILMSAIGLLGLYIGQIHYEVKNRPLYFIADRLGNK